LRIKCVAAFESSNTQLPAFRPSVPGRASAGNQRGSVGAVKGYSLGKTFLGMSPMNGFDWWAVVRRAISSEVSLSQTIKESAHDPRINDHVDEYSLPSVTRTMNLSCSPDFGWRHLVVISGLAVLYGGVRTGLAG
jgi:hypothetical protein